MEFNNTNWNFYKAFIVAYETKNLHLAAEILGISRPAVRWNLKQLSDQLGVALFNSTTEGVFPTGAATNLYEMVKGVTVALTDAEDHVRTFNRHSVGIIKIGLSGLHVDYYVKNFMKTFCKNYPNISFEFFDQERFDLLESRQIDFILSIDHNFRGRNFKVRPLFTLQNIFVASKDYLKSQNLTEEMTIETVLANRIIAQRGTWNEFEKNTKASIPTWGRPNVIRVPSAEIAWSLCKESLGIGYYCRELKEKLHGADSDMVELKITGDVVLPKVSVAIGYNSMLQRPAKEFLYGLIDLDAPSEIPEKRVGGIIPLTSELERFKMVLVEKGEPKE
jgi:DNA-binding transcriptional LysR family regulator